MTQTLSRGDLARVTAEYPAGWDDVEKLYVGAVFEVDEYVPARPPEEVQEDELPGDFYYGNHDGGFGNATVPASIVVLEQESGNRRLPTVDEIMRAVSSELCSVFDEGFDTDQVDVDGPGALIVYGDRDGMRFGFYVNIGTPFRVDF